MSEEGFGGFRDTWLIRGVGIREAKALLQVERELIDLADRYASNGEEFDAICEALETGDAETLPTRLRQSSVSTDIALKVCEAEDDSPSIGLDLGVAGLVYGLAAAGFWTAASCRGHPGTYAWSDHPIVVFACDRHRVAVLQPLVEAAGCGLTTDEHREGMLAVVAESVEDTMALARMVADHRSEFIPHRVSRPRSGGQATQGVFDFGDY
ncbi:hypothetical protein [Ferrimicrobium sp.]|uniref:hypothetical protein n=1 Tax=Ferrimicrobium sp. TaxID=2926050 RepID=UPI00261F017B|nr:hypothetical protein [Ferrimicrobium sp.]